MNRSHGTGIRVNLTLQDDVVEIIDRIGAVTGAGRATVIRQFLENCAPGLSMVAQASEQAAKKDIDAFTTLAKTLEQVSEEADQLSLHLKKERRKAYRQRGLANART